MLETVWESRWLPEYLMKASRRAQLEFSKRRVTTLSEAEREAKAEVSDGICQNKMGL